MPKDQRVELVLTVLRGAEPLEVLARRHGVSANTLRRWKDDFLAAGTERLTGTGNTVQAAAELKKARRDLAERDMVIGELTIANRFLKKIREDRLGMPSSESD
jgi:transposase